MNNSDPCLQCAAEHLGAASAELTMTVTSPGAVFRAMHFVQLAFLELQRHMAAQQEDYGDTLPTPGALLELLGEMRENYRSPGYGPIIDGMLYGIIAELLVPPEPPELPAPE